MKDQTELDFEGARLKAGGMALVEEHTPEKWKADFTQHAEAILTDNGSVTAEEVVAIVGRPPGSLNAIGGAMSNFAKGRNLVRDYVKAKHAEAHARVISRWSLPLNTQSHGHGHS